MKLLTCAVVGGNVMLAIGAGELWGRGAALMVAGAMFSVYAMIGIIAGIFAESAAEHLAELRKADNTNCTCHE
jgi:hypothetical protein